ncbi:hypothetical protein [Halobacillus karajensis]|uniref:Uncharacterized protein n=1 Tax=Halobacillus karajensis TaxID=195088 RepID=A0A059NYM6_9BACI|nr:hypothetical protein [Halobacillus karajensis]CDQ22592.1 hypothetical protein BN983_00805 [Halobacillus karajensis]CDQ26074.1 hypothetical protein BN981_00285 [Halobacillus karajensis]
MRTFYITVNANSPQEYYQQVRELERRGYEPHAPMRKTTREMKNYEMHQDSQGRRFSKNEYKGSYDHHKYSGMYRKVDA